MTTDRAKAFRIAVAEDLMDHKRRLDLTWDVLSEETDIPARSLMRYFKGEQSPTIEQLFVIAEALGTRPDLIYRAARKQVEGR